jgi:DNA-binding CsgD family transcriptional regulator/tetratricopeptide (TPR) repeat protein
MAAALLEREAPLGALNSALAGAGTGAGSVVLLSGEAGVGKTSLVRAFAAKARGSARVLVGACDDLLTPRTLGPLRDAVRAAGGGPLAAVVAGGDRDAVLAATVEELSDPRRPTVLVVEDVHWADEATLDVLRYVGRRVAELPAVLLLTYRDDEIRRDHPLRRVLGGLSGSEVLRIVLTPLSRDAVASLAGGSAPAGDALYRLTDGNPFFVSEVLASPPGVVPTTVVDAVLARIRQLAPATQRALEQLAVVPSRTELGLVPALLHELTVLREAELAGIVQVGDGAVGFRHELARQAVLQSCPASARIWFNQQVLSALLALDEPDLARVVHHAIEAGDDAAVVAHAPEAALRAIAAGAQGQAVTLYEQALRRHRLLSPDERAGLAESYAWALFHSDRRYEALRAAEEAVALREELGGDATLGQALACLSVQQWSCLRTVAALESSERAATLLARGGDGAGRVSSLLHLAVILINIDREGDGIGRVNEALAMADRIGAQHLTPMGLIYRGRARLQLGEKDGLAELHEGLELARTIGNHEYVLWGYHNLVALLWRLGRYDEIPPYLEAGAEYGRDHDFPTHERGREAYRYRLLGLLGDWDAAERGLRQVLGDPDDPGVLDRHALPTLARLAVRRGRDDAEAAIVAARSNAKRADSLLALVPTAAAEAEHAWLTGRPATGLLSTALLPRVEPVGRERDRGELLRYLRRLGEPVEAFPGCPKEYAAGLRGDWRAAASAWEHIGDPYERALELAESGEVAPTLEALADFDRLGARPAAGWARRRLRELGVATVPRGPQPATRHNPAGLTSRQVDILRLLATGRTNAEIAQTLFLSVRTVDHHVSAVLQKLEVTSRREAAQIAVRLGVTDSSR